MEEVSKDFETSVTPKSPVMTLVRNWLTHRFYCAFKFPQTQLGKCSIHVTRTHLTFKIPPNLDDMQCSSQNTFAFMLSCWEESFICSSHEHHLLGAGACACFPQWERTAAFRWRCSWGTWLVFLPSLGLVRQLCSSWTQRVEKIHRFAKTSGYCRFDCGFFRLAKVGVDSRF